MTYKHIINSKTHNYVTNLVSSKRISEDVEFSVRITCEICEQVSTESGRVWTPYTTTHNVYVLYVMFEVRV